MATPWDDLELREAPGQSGRFTTEVSGAWMLVAVAQGGIMVALAARAMERVLDVPEQLPRSLSVVFVAPVATGPVEIDVTLLRRGRSMSQLTATVRNAGATAGLIAMGVFGASRRGFEFTQLPFPDVPGPDGLRSFRDPVPEGVAFEFRDPPLPFWEQVIDCRPALGRPPWEPHVPGPAEEAFWYRLDDPPITVEGRLDHAAAIVVCDTMPGAVYRRLGPDTDPWFGPSADLTIHLFGHAQPGWLLAHNRAHYAGDGYASVEMAVWDPAARSLVAYATQMMFFAFSAWM